MDWTGQWIWIEGDPNPIDYWLCARTSFDLDRVPADSSLHITADSRYEVWINGERLGNGPVRGWPFAWRFDTYDLAGFLRPGKNAIAVLVIHHGVGTFQSLPTRGGLLAQIEADGRVVAATDPFWKLHHHPALSRRTPRISCQQGFVEHYDAYKEQAAWHHAAEDRPLYETGPLANPPILDWRSTDFDDCTWKPAQVVGKAGCAPWTNLLPRDIPFLTEEPIYPVNVLRARTVHAPKQIWAFSLRQNLLTGYRESNPRSLCGFVALLPVVNERTQVTLRNHYDVAGQLRVNGQDIQRTRNEPPPWDHGYTWNFTLRAGENLLLWDVTGNYHEWTAAFEVEADPPIPGYAIPNGFTPWATLGPFDSGENRDFQAIWNAQSRFDMEPYYYSLKPVQPHHQIDEHAFFRTAAAKVIENLEVTSFAALGKPAAGSVGIPPNSKGDTEILLDFGRITVGFWEFEIDADEGVCLDLVGIESIQDGVLDFPWGANVAMSYITCRGRQTFRSVIRRGCRYLLLTVRGAQSTVRFRSLRTLLNTYPLEERGEFHCSDDRLNNIWRMGQWTTRLCCEDTYVDCPTYEQTFWVGDCYNGGIVNHYAFGAYALTRRSLLLAADSLARSPVVESQVPSAWQDILTTWSLLWVLACDEYYQASGDSEFVRMVYPAIERQMDYLLKQRDARGLIHMHAWNLLDWAPVDTPRDAACAHIQAWTIMALERQIKLAGVAGVHAGIPTLSRSTREIARALNRFLWDESRQAYRDSIHLNGSPSGTFSQGTNTVILLAGCAPPDRELAIRRLLVDPPQGMVRVGSPFFMFFTFEALTRIGAYDQVLDLMREHWGLMLDKGATTCWETFPGWEPGGRWTRSHCHAWSSAPTYFLSRYQLGVAPMEPGFARVSIAPIPSGLSWARGKVPTPQGDIEVNWRANMDEFVLDARLPPGVPATVQLPVPKSEFLRITHSGVSTVASEDVPTFLADPGAAVHIEARRGI